MVVLTSLLAGAGWAASKWAEPLVDKAEELLFNESGKKLLEEIRSKVRAYTGGIPPNHDLEHAVRLSELTSTMMVLDLYSKQEEVDRFDNRSAEPSPFIAAAQSWVHGQIGLSMSLHMQPNEELERQLEQTLDAVLSETDQSRLKELLREAETSAWQELLDGAASKGAGEPPNGLAHVFRAGDTDQVGWSMIFLAFMREALKEKPRAQVAYVTSRLGAIRTITLRIERNIHAFGLEQVKQTAMLQEVHQTIQEGVPLKLRPEDLQILAEIYRENRGADISDRMLTRIEDLNVNLSAINTAIGVLFTSMGYEKVESDKVVATLLDVADRMKKSSSEKPDQPDGSPWFTTAVGEGTVDVKRVALVLDDAIMDEKVVILMQGANLRGQIIYTYVQLTLRNLQRLKDDVNNGKDFEPAAYGKVIASGFGTPPDELRARMTKEYNMIDVPKPAEKDSKKHFMQTVLLDGKTQFIEAATDYNRDLFLIEWSNSKEVLYAYADDLLLDVFGSLVRQVTKNPEPRPVVTVRFLPYSTGPSAE